MPFSNRKQEIFPFIVMLKRKHKRPAWLVGMLLGLLFVLYLAWRALYSTDWLILTLLSVALTGILVAELRQYQKKKKLNLSFLNIIGVVALIILPLPFGLAYLLIAYLGYLSGRPEEIGFSDNRIVIKRLFSKEIQWDELSNAMIKDGILTLDFKNNTLFQAETDDEDENDEFDASEEEFNAYCNARLNP